MDGKACFEVLEGRFERLLQPTGHSNGNIVDRSGRLVTCEHGGRRGSRTEADGQVIALADGYRGKRLNSLNDIVERSDGTLWFTNPTYGIDSDHEGHKGMVEQAGNFVYRLDPLSGELKIVADDFVQPKGHRLSVQRKSALFVDADSSHRPDGPGTFTASMSAKTGGWCHAACSPNARMASSTG